MSFGFAVGDFITVYRLATKIRQEFVNAPSQFRDISDEIRSLSIVLLDVEVVVHEQELSSQQKIKLHDIVDGCRNVLEKLEKTLGEYGELKLDPESVGKRVKRVWKRLTWEPEDIKELRSRINSNVTLLNAFNGQLTRDNVVKLVRHQDDQERQAILDWLTPIDYSTQQNDFIGRRQEGTGQWLLNSNEFHMWLNQRKQTLFCPGIPGAGKTMITSIVVDHLWTEFQNDANIGIAYLYCNYRQQQEQKAEDLMSSLLKQLAQEQLSVPEAVKNLYEHHRIKRTRPSFDEIVRVLHFTIGLYSRVFIIIDALDECHVSNQGRNRLLSAIFSLQAQTQINLYATSRFVPEITSQFERCMSKEIRAKDDDVLRYINGRIPQLLRSRISKYLDLQNAIRRQLVEAVDGMFLLAQLHMDSLLSKSTPGAIRLALQDLPRGIKGLDTLYEQAMKRIDGQEEDFRELAKQVLSWVTHAKRPLTTAELRYALAVREGARELDEDFLPEIEDLVSVCAGLVTIDEQSDIIRWIHYTTQEYFERTWTLWVPNAQADIAGVCLTYLSFDAFAAGVCQTDQEFKARLRLNVLYDYTARNWGHHARAALTEVENLILDFLECETKVSSSSQAMMAGRDSDYNQRIPTQMTGAHLAAYFGLSETKITFLGARYDLDSKDAYGRTPLSWAAKNGHEAVVKLLLDKGGVDPDSKDSAYDRTPLSWATEKGHEAVVKLLLDKEGVDPDSKGNSGQTPLSWAAGEGHEAVVKLLLDKEGVDPDSKDSYDRTPLSWAAREGHEAAVKLLLDREGVDPDSKDSYGRTPLARAAENGHEVVVKLLLRKEGVDPDSKDSYGQASLSWAAEKGHEAVVKLLLDKEGIDLDSKDSYGRTPLSWAAREGHEAVVKLLLDKEGIDPDSKDSSNQMLLPWATYGQTPLSWAAREGHEAVVKLFLDKEGVGPDSKDSYGRTPLSWAAREGHEAVVKLLLGKEGVDPDSQNTYGQTPLSRAAREGHEAVVKLLLDKEGVDPDSKNTHGQTPLSQAAENGYEAVVKLLLDKEGVDLDSRDSNGQTPLSWAAGNGHEAVVKLLLDKEGVDPDSKDSHSQTPLSWAAREGHVAVVKLLLDKIGVNPDSKDSVYGQTPLSWAAENGHEAIAKLLLEGIGVNPDSKDTYGQTPLSWAAREGHDAVVKLLLDKEGVDPDSKDSYGRTPLLRAAENRHEAVVKLLLDKEGVDPDSKDSNGQTPLWWAERRDTADGLISLGQENEREAVVKLLQSRGALSL